MTQWYPVVNINAVFEPRLGVNKEEVNPEDGSKCDLIVAPQELLGEESQL